MDGELDQLRTEAGSGRRLGTLSCSTALQLYASVRRLECASALAQRAAAGDKLMAGLVTSEYGTAGLGVEAAPVFCTYHQWQKNSSARD